MRNFFKKKSSSAAPADGDVIATCSGTILIVDDSPTEQHVFKSVLTKAGYTVESATDGEKGVDAAKRIQPDLILMDVVMPVLNGFQATRVLSNDQTTANIPVIMVTTKGQETDKRWGMRQGARDYLVKPVDTDLLLKKIKKLLGD